jgi:hypothetical protein
MGRCQCGSGLDSETEALAKPLVPLFVVGHLLQKLFKSFLQESELPSLREAPCSLENFICRYQPSLASFVLGDA